MHQAKATRLFSGNLALRREWLIALLLVIALLAFEIFNFETTQFALTNLLGNIRFLDVGWATILAIAFCAIDFAGLVRFFSPHKNVRESKEIMFLAGAWVLGATMNAVMTWWAVSLSLLGHQFGNEILSREQLLRIVPVFVAVLVWLTRILFIGGLSVAGERLISSRGTGGQKLSSRRRGTSGKENSGRGRGQKPVLPSPYQPSSQSNMRSTTVPARGAQATSSKLRRRQPFSGPPAPGPGPEPVYEPLFDDLPPQVNSAPTRPVVGAAGSQSQGSSSGRRPGHGGTPTMPPIQRRSFSPAENQ